MALLSNSPAPESGAPAACGQQALHKGRCVKLFFFFFFNFLLVESGSRRSSTEETHEVDSKAALLPVCTFQLNICIV